MEDETLIERVRAFPELYDKSSIDFRNIEKKKLLWNEVGADYGVSGDSCARRWASLRDRFSKELKKCNEANVEGAASRWHLFELMTFVRKHIKPKTYHPTIKFETTAKDLEEPVVINNEDFIQRIQEHPELYDRSCSAYLDSEKRAVLWNIIGYDFNITGDECMKKWVHLRDKFTKEFRKLAALKEDGIEEKSQWRYFDAMSFLTKQVEAKPPRVYRLDNPSASFDDMLLIDDEKLVEKVQEQPELYNKSFVGPRYVKRKKVLWNQIGEELGVPGEDCIRRWTALRDRFTKELRRCNLIGSSGTPKESRWRLFPVMSFLTDYVVPKTFSPKTSTLNDCTPIEFEECIIEDTIEPVRSPSPLSLVFDEIDEATSPKRERLDEKLYEKMEGSPIRSQNTAETSKACSSQSESSNSNTMVHSFGELVKSLVESLPKEKRLKAIKEAVDAIYKVVAEPDS